MPLTNYTRVMPYEVQTPVFEGPFDLLLHLILREQVDLYEVSLSRIVDAYLGELDSMRERDAKLDLEIATEFLLIAATLIELKARRLLPGRGDIELDDELGLWEERDLLVARLLQCKTFKDAAKVLAHLGDEAGRSFPRKVGPEERFLAIQPDLLAGVTAAQLKAAFLKAVAPKPVPKVDIRHLHQIKITVGDAVAELVDELPRVGRITFRRLTQTLVDRIEIVVRFLAVLELFKQGLIELEQPECFGDIVVVWLGADRADPELAMAGIDSYEG